MKRSAVDYRDLRLSNLTSPRYRHIFLLLGWPAYFLMYALTEHLIPWEVCYTVSCPLDDRIPFNEWFVIFYVGWYGLIAASLLYFFFYNVNSFRKLQTYIILVQALATVVYILLPTRQDLRPESFPRENPLTAVMGFLYRIDTPTGVCPSLHVAISAGIASTWLREKTAPPWLRTAVAFFCLGVCMSVAFVKQHSVLDILTAIPLCLLTEWFVFFRNK